MPPPPNMAITTAMITIMGITMITVTIMTATATITIMVTATITTTMDTITITAMPITGTSMVMTTSKKPRVAPLRAKSASARVQENGEADALTPAALFRLTSWLSPAYPVGAFSYSSGIEWAVENGDVTNAETLGAWLAALLEHGSGFCDGVLFAHAHRAIASLDDKALKNIAELGAALAPSRERHLETTTQGRAFVEITCKAWPCTALDRFVGLWTGAIAYPVAVGVACAGHDIPLAPSLHLFLQAVTANWVSAGARLIPLGQTDSQRVMGVLEPVIAATAQRTLSASLDDISSATFRADISSLRHETQYTRLFRS